MLELCQVLIKDQLDSSVAGPQGLANHKEVRRQGPYNVNREEMSEEQGWVARMLHLFRADALDTQYEVCNASW